jgi:putative hemolysin
MWDILILMLLISANGLLALSEIAVISSNKYKLEKLAAQGYNHARTILAFKADPHFFLSSIQVGITLVGVFAGAFGGVRLAGYLVPILSWTGLPDVLLNKVVLFGTLLIITYVNILLGELLPKTIALHAPEKMAIKMAPFVIGISRLFNPAVKSLQISLKILNKWLGLTVKRSDRITEDDIRSLIKIANSEGTLVNKEAEMLQNIFRFANRYALQIMTPASKLNWLDLSDFEMAKQILKSHHHTKFLVGRGQLNHLLGYISSRDLLSINLDSTSDILKILRQPVELQKEENAIEILERFGHSGIYIGVVRDHQQKVLGIITLHDLIEGVFGMLPIKGELIEAPITKREDGSILVNGQVLMDEIMEHIPVDGSIPDEERFETIALLVIKRNQGKLPPVGFKCIRFGLHLEVMDLDGYSIDKVLISKPKNNS